MTFRMTVKTKGALTGGELEVALNTWAAEVGPVLATEIRRRAPVSPTQSGGRLRSSIRFEQRGSGQGLQLRYLSDAPYARVVTDGSRAHRIEPRNARALHWMDGGRDVFARAVNHPGTRPNPFPRKAIEARKSWLMERLIANVSKEVEKK